MPSQKTSKNNINDLKALVLAGGKGTRLKPLTNTIAKQLLPVANRPILHYVLDQIIEAGISDIGIIVSPENQPNIVSAIGDGKRWSASITYIVQQEPHGLAHAVLTAKDFLKDSSFLMFLGDNLIQADIKSFIKEFIANSFDAMVLLKEVPDPRMFGVAELDASGRVISLEEKPKQPKSNFALVGVYLFNAEIHKAISQIKPSWRGELEITDAIQKLLDNGKKVHSHVLTGWWLDTGKKDDLLEANRVVLDSLLQRDVQGECDSSSTIVGRVAIGKGARLINSTVRGPVSIAEDCTIINSLIGPFTSIASGTKIKDSCIEHSVILENCSISCIEHLADSVIGKNSVVSREINGLKITRLFVGDDVKIEL